MRKVPVSEARRQLTKLLAAVESGEEIIITRRGHPVAKLEPIVITMNPFPDRSELRRSIPPMQASAEATIRELRKERCY